MIEDVDDARQGLSSRSILYSPNVSGLRTGVPIVSDVTGEPEPHEVILQRLHQEDSNIGVTIPFGYRAFPDMGVLDQIG
jgi:hypothetical protein